MGMGNFKVDVNEQKAANKAYQQSLPTIAEQRAAIKAYRQGQLIKAYVGPVNHYADSSTRKHAQASFETYYPKTTTTQHKPAPNPRRESGAISQKPSDITTQRTRSLGLTGDDSRTIKSQGQAYLTLGANRMMGQLMTLSDGQQVFKSGDNTYIKKKQTGQWVAKATYDAKNDKPVAEILPNYDLKQRTLEQSPQNNTQMKYALTLPNGRHIAVQNPNIILTNYNATTGNVNFLGADGSFHSINK
jgi:hypothetical protein